MENILADELKIKSCSMWANQWFILTSGDFAEKKYNCMTIAWGSIGTMWNKPFVQVVVRPTRYTNDFMQAYPDFTVCAFPDTYRKSLQILGSKSGRKGDKIAASGITPCKSSMVAAPVYLEANLMIECKKIYSDKFNPQSFIDPQIGKNYPDEDYHFVYFGEILAITGDRSLYA